MALTYSTAELASPDRKLRAGGIEQVINAMNEALEDLTTQITVLEQELHLVCRPTGPVCGEEACERAIQSPVSDALVTHMRRIKSLRDTVASIRSNLDL